MKYLAFIFFVFGILFTPVFTHADKDFLRFVFRVHCEENDTQCEKEIPEDAKQEKFLLDAPVGQQTTIDLVIENPSREMINSVRAKLKYDIDAIKVIDLDTEKSDFPLAAPGENDIDEKKGTILMGRSLTGGSKNSAEFLVGSITFQPLQTGATFEFMNYQENELGDTGIYYTSGITTENKLKEEPNPLQIGKTTTLPVQNPTGNTGVIVGQPVTLPVVTNPSQSGTGLSNRNPLLPRPVEVKVQTDDMGNVKLIWPMSKSELVKGYYLYYGQKSGFYLRRRDVGNTNYALFPDLPRGTKYYFAVSAYDEFDKESDYSDEVYVTVGLPGSESHGFSGDPQQAQETQNTDTSGEIGKNGKENTTLDPSKIKQTTESGPEHILFFLIISLGIAFVGYGLRRV